MKLSDLVDFNPKRPLEKGGSAPFIEMADLPEGEREAAQIGPRQSTRDLGGCAGCV